MRIDLNESLASELHSGCLQPGVYQQPQLRLLGEVWRLTEGGSSGTMETSPTCMGMNTSRVMC